MEVEVLRWAFAEWLAGTVGLLKPQSSGRGEQQLQGPFTGHWKEQFSFAHLHALAAQAGCVVDLARVDLDSIDCRISKPGVNARGVWGPVLEVQLKCTSVLDRDSAGSPVFDLAVRAYNALRDERCFNPRMLAVLEVPSDPADWIACTDGEICLRHRAYWTSLKGEPPTSNVRSVRVSVAAPLDGDALLHLLDTMDHSGVWL